jgi:NADPH2:quinone reductase
VEAVGDGVRGINVNDRVVYMTGSGTYASHVQIAADSAIRVPDAVSDVDATAVFLKGLTAWMLLFEIRAARPGDSALVWAPVGGVGSLLLPWAASLGVRVIAATSSREKAERALALGATDALTARTGVAAAVRELTNGVGVDVAYDSVGAASQEESLASLKPRGLWVSYGNASGMVAPVPPGRLAMGGSLMMTRPSLFHFVTQRRDLERGAQALFGALKVGTLKAHISREIPLSEAAQAHRAIEAGETTGSLILRP